MDFSYKLDLLELEKLKLHEEIDYLQQCIQQQADQYSDQILLKDSEIVNLQLINQQLNKQNNDILSKLQYYRKNEETLNNANHNFTNLQKKLEFLQNENNQLQQKIQTISAHSNQYQQNWQRVSSQLKQQTQTKQNVKTLEQHLEKRSIEVTQLKEKVMQLQLQITIQKQAEQEYKQSIQNKITCLLQELQQAQDNQFKLQQVYSSKQCQQCQQYIQEIQQLKPLINSDNIQTEQNRINLQINSELQDQVKQQYNRILELELENHNLIKQMQSYQQIFQQEQQLTQQLQRSDISISNNKSILNNSSFIRIFKIIEQIQDEQQRELLKKTVYDLGNEIDKKDSYYLQLQETRTMYDRLLVKYYALQKSIGYQEDQPQQQQQQQQQQQYYQQQQVQQTHQKKQQSDDYNEIIHLDTAKYKPANTPKQIKKKQFQSLDLSKSQQF